MLTDHESREGRLVFLRLAGRQRGEKRHHPAHVELTIGEWVMPGTVLTVAVATMTVANSLGINTHIDFKKYGYENLAVTAASINYLGIKSLRDCPGSADAVGANGSWQQIANATGAKFDAYMT